MAETGLNPSASSQVALLPIPEEILKRADFQRKWEQATGHLAAGARQELEEDLERAMRTTDHVTALTANLFGPGGQFHWIIKWLKAVPGGIAAQRTLLYAIADYVNHSNRGNRIINKAISSALRATGPNLDQILGQPDDTATTNALVASIQDYINQALSAFGVPTVPPATTPTGTGTGAPPAPPAAPAAASQLKLAKIIAEMPTRKNKRSKALALFGILDDEVDGDIVPEVEDNAGQIREAWANVLAEDKDAFVKLLPETPESDEALKRYRAAQRHQRPDGSPLSDAEAEREIIDSARVFVRHHAEFLEFLLACFSASHRLDARYLRARDWLDGFLNKFGIRRSTRFVARQHTHAIAKSITTAIAVGYGLLVAWVAILIGVSLGARDWLFTVTLVTFVFMILGSIIGVAIPGKTQPREQGADINAPQPRNLAVGRRLAIIVASGLLGVLAIALGFWLATLLSETSDGFHLPAYLLAAALLIVWNYVAVGAIQKIINGVGSAPAKFIDRTFGEGSSRGMTEALKGNTFLSGVGSTVLGAVMVMWSLLPLLWLLGLDLYTRGGVVVLVTFFALAASLIKDRVLKAFPKLHDFFQDWAKKEANALINFRNIAGLGLIVAAVATVWIGPKRIAYFKGEATKFADDVTGFSDQDVGYNGGSDTVKIRGKTVETVSCEDMLAAFPDGYCNDWPDAANCKKCEGHW